MSAIAVKKTEYIGKPRKVTTLVYYENPLRSFPSVKIKFLHVIMQKNLLINAISAIVSTWFLSCGSGHGMKQKPARLKRGTGPHCLPEKTLHKIVS